MTAMHLHPRLEDSEYSGHSHITTPDTMHMHMLINTNSNSQAYGMSSADMMMALDRDMHRMALHQHSFKHPQSQSEIQCPNTPTSLRATPMSSLPHSPSASDDNFTLFGDLVGYPHSHANSNNTQLHDRRRVSSTSILSTRTPSFSSQGTRLSFSSGSSSRLAASSSPTEQDTLFSPPSNSNGQWPASASVELMPLEPFLVEPADSVFSNRSNLGERRRTTSAAATLLSLSNHHTLHQSHQSQQGRGMTDGPFDDELFMRLQHEHHLNQQQPHQPQRHQSDTSFHHRRFSSERHSQIMPPTLSITGEIPLASPSRFSPPPVSAPLGSTFRNPGTLSNTSQQQNMPSRHQGPLSAGPHHHTSTHPFQMPNVIMQPLFENSTLRNEPSVNSISTPPPTPSSHTSMATTPLMQGHGSETAVGSTPRTTPARGSKHPVPPALKTQIHNLPRRRAMSSDGTLSISSSIAPSQKTSSGSGSGASAGSGSDDGNEAKKVNLYKTELCRSFEETGNCRYGNKCQFAHSTAELRCVDRHPKYKTQMCKTFWEKGSCPYGKRCCFIHTSRPADVPLSAVPMTPMGNHPMQLMEPATPTSHTFSPSLSSNTSFSGQQSTTSSSSTRRASEFGRSGHGHTRSLTGGFDFGHEMIHEEKFGGRVRSVTQPVVFGEWES